MGSSGVFNISGYSRGYLGVYGVGKGCKEHGGVEIDIFNSLIYI